jgi:RNA polymerase-binding transcription factor DksA
VARRALEARCRQLRGEGCAACPVELAQLADAIERLDKGTWGVCVTCLGAIGRNRLRALPEARSCVRCSSSCPVTHAVEHTHEQQEL